MYYNITLTTDLFLLSPKIQIDLYARIKIPPSNRKYILKYIMSPQISFQQICFN